MTNALLTREQVDSHVDEILAFARAAGQRIAAANRAAGHERQVDLPPEVWDAKARGSLMIEAELRATIILGLDDQDRLAPCDRDDLVAEALMMRA